MAFELLAPVENQLPDFQPNQVLTYNHLNQVVDYLYQQERYTRNKLIGTGIVCGLSFRWETLGANAQVIIEDGCAITSAGYLVIFKQPRATNGSIIPYTHRRNFDRLGDFIPFDDASVYNNETIYELITLDEFNVDTTAAKTLLLESDRTNRVLVLLFDQEIKNVAKCLDESCDDKGKIYFYTPRPLLIPITVLNNILDAASNKKFYTEPGRGWKAIDSRLEGANLDYATVPNLFMNNDLDTINTPLDLQNLFKSRLGDTNLDPLKNRINALLNAFPWMFSAQLDALKSEMAALTLPPAANLGDLYKTNAKNFRDTFNANYIQYLYDFVRDVADAYNELYEEATSLVSECGGNEYRHPFHIMLGKTQPNFDTLASYEEDKYLDPVPRNFRYRHYFIPSPVMDEQFMLYESVQQLLKRLVRLINNFGVSTEDTTIKISPSRDCRELLEIRAIPYYYLKAAAPLIQKVWNYHSTWRNKAGRHQGYQLVGNAPSDQDNLLNNDFSKNDFYRIEGHINSAVVVALATIDDLRKQYNLPFGTAAVSVQKSGSSMSTTCHFPDLEEEYRYYRDRVLGYIREYLYQLDGLPANQVLADIRSQLVTMLEILINVRCLEDFPYAKYKEAYKNIFEILLELLAKSLQGNTANANQQFNTFQNIFNIIFFCPIYKIWYAYKYRVGIIDGSTVDSLPALYDKYTGLEHLAGVRRGETFLMVYDSASNNVIADFNIPGMAGCGCDCKGEACDEKHRTIVQPLQKPIIMVVDFSSTKTRDKNKAFWVQADGVYRLELDSMGFYKGDSQIGEKVIISDDAGGKKENNFLRGFYLNNGLGGEKLRVDCKLNDKPPYGVHRLFYHLEGDFKDHVVHGMLILVIMGKLNFQDHYKADVIIGSVAKPEYTYKPADFKATELKLSFVEDVKTRTVDGEKVPVYATPVGNEIGIFTDTKGYPYFKSVRARKPAVEEVSYLLEANGIKQPGTLTWNVIDQASKPPANKYDGKVLLADGTPVVNARVRLGTKEVFTNEKGEYTVTGIKAGDAIEIDKEGFRRELVQVNNNMATDTRLTAKPALDIKGIDLGKVPMVEDLTKNIKLTELRNFFNK